MAMTVALEINNDVIAANGLRASKWQGHRSNGRATLVAGAVIVALASVMADDVIDLLGSTPGGTAAATFPFAITAGVGFEIRSTSAANTAQFCWHVLTTNFLG